MLSRCILQVRAETQKDPSAWVDALKKREVVRKAKEAEQAANGSSAISVAPTTDDNPFAARSARARAFTYVYVCDVLADDTTMEVLYWKDVYASKGIKLCVPELGALGSYTISRALDKLDGFLEESEGKVRLIGRQVGALVCALYASKHPEKVDSLFLLEPAFAFEEVAEALYGGAEAMEAWKQSGVLEVDGTQLGYDLIADAAKHEAYPFVKMPAYVVHGNQDEVIPMDNSLAWVRGASVMMRGGRVGNSTEEADERRLLEMATGHGLVGCLESVQTRMLTYWNLMGPGAIEPKANLEKTKRQAFARDHSWNWEVYDEMVKKFEAEQDAKDAQEGGEK